MEEGVVKGEAATVAGVGVGATAAGLETAGLVILKDGFFAPPAGSAGATFLATGNGAVDGTDVATPAKEGVRLRRGLAVEVVTVVGAVVVAVKAAAVVTGFAAGLVAGIVAAKVVRIEVVGFVTGVGLGSFGVGF